MNGPLEFRQYMKRATMDDLTAGVTPMRQRINGEQILFCPPQLQWRYRGKEGWSDWQEVPFVRDGDNA